MTGSVFASPGPTPARFGRSRVTCFPTSLGLFGLSPNDSAGLSPWTHHPFASSGDVTCASFRLRLGVLARDRPSAPKQSADLSTTGKSASRPARPSPSGRRSSTSPEVCSPTAHVSRVARCPAAACLRTIPLRRFAARPRSVARIWEIEASLALAVFRYLRDPDDDARAGGRSGWVVRSSPTCRRFLAGHAFVDREDATPVVFDPSGRCDRRNRFARSRRIQPVRALPLRSRVPTRVMHRRVLSRGVPLPVARAIAARPDEAFFPLTGSSFKLLPARVRSRPAALLGLCPSQVCSRLRVVAPHECGG